MQVSVDHVRKHASHAYLSQPNQIVQVFQMLYQCLWNSLSVLAKRRINIYDEAYTIQDNPVGTFLLRIIVCESAIDSNITTELITRDLKNLDLMMPGEAKNYKSGEEAAEPNDWVLSTRTKEETNGISMYFVHVMARGI